MPTKKLPQNFYNFINNYEQSEILYDYFKKNKTNDLTGYFLLFLYATMPYSDLGGYPPEVFHSYAKHAAFLWNKIDYSDIPFEIFLWYVLSYRVGNEEIEPCRSAFYSETLSRIDGKSTYEAALEINYWCAENATYRTTDDRTASARAVYTTGYGRCGEESVFAVNALRSAGIPARQVYVPWWSHCDDNHAWVEVYVDGKWQFLGACEPEPILNRGWFTAAASRAMMVHSRIFCRLLPNEAPLLFSQNNELLISDGVIFENQTARYAETKKVKFKAREKLNRIYLEVVNMGKLKSIASLIPDKNGEATITLGIGNLVVHAVSSHKSARHLINTADGDCFEIDLTDDLPVDFRFCAPKETDKNRSTITEKQAAIRDGRMDEARCRRETKSGMTKDPLLSEIIATLPQKDRDYHRSDVLWEHSEFMKKYRQSMPEDMYLKYMLCPRIYLEPLSDYVTYLSSAFSYKELMGFRQNPMNIAQWIRANIKDSGSDSEILPAMPAAVMKTGYGSFTDRMILFAAIARTIGLPSSVSEKSTEVFYEGEWRDIYSNAVAELNLGINRLPCGDVLVNTLGKIPAAKTEDMLQSVEIEQFNLLEASSQQLIKKGKQIFIWLQPSKEPTEHILNEILVKNKEYETVRDKVCFIVNDNYMSDRLLDSVAKKTETNMIYHDNTLTNINTLARKMYLDPEKLPLLILMDENHKIIYATNGYSVGTWELVLKLLRFDKAGNTV